jgi:hypothetical protein
MKITAPSASALAQNGRSCSLELEIAHAALELGGRERGVVQRQRGEADQPVGVPRHVLGDPVVAQPIHLDRLFRFDPVGALLHDARADDLDVDAGRIHLGKPRLHFGHPLEQRLRHALRSGHRLRVLRMRIGELHHLGHQHVRMYVDHDRLRGRALGPHRLRCAPCRLARVRAGRTLGRTRRLFLLFG